MLLFFLTLKIKVSRVDHPGLRQNFYFGALISLKKSEMTDYSMLNLLKMKLVFVFGRLLVLFFIFYIFKTYQWIIRVLAFMIAEVFF